MRRKPLASNKKQGPWLWIVAVLILAGIGWMMFRDAEQPAEQTAAVPPAASSVPQDIDNTRINTLPPDIFQDAKAREAYQTAREIPEVLSELPCFCGCMTTHGHKNNLFCFMDEHGSACEICMDIALDAGTMHRNGASIDEIEGNIRAKYAQYSTVQ
jgi:hypothetical protein